MKDLIKQINQLSVRLGHEEGRLSELREARKALDFERHQKQAFCKIGDVSVDITYNNAQTGYQSKVKRGYEMIHLGMQKVFNQRIEDQEKRVLKTKQEIQEAVSKISVEDI